MSLFPLRNLTFAAIGALGLAGCASYGPYLGASIGVGSGYYDPYYGRDYSYGYGYGGYDPYYGYGGYGSYSRYGPPYGGWYSGYYYPGSGVYVYDRERRRHRMSDAQRRYWERRRIQRLSNPVVRQTIPSYQADRRRDRRDYRVERREVLGDLRRGQVTREAGRAERQQERREHRREQRDSRSGGGRENRNNEQPE